MSTGNALYQHNPVIQQLIFMSTVDASCQQLCSMSTVNALYQLNTVGQHLMLYINQ